MPAGMVSAALPLKVRALGPALRRLRPASLASSIKRLAGIERVVIEVDGDRFRVDPISHLGHCLIRDGVYEPGMAQVLRRFLAPGATFVDVGANEGYFSVLAGRLVGPPGRVIAVEPQRRLRPVLEENVRLNALANVRLFMLAVSDTEGSARLHLSPDVNTGTTGLARATRYPVATDEVRTTTLARLLQDAAVATVDLMKIDIEGFEHEAILGSLDLFRRGAVRALVLELHPPALTRRGLDALRLTTALQECGYREQHVAGRTVFGRHG
jgi:FkbM family methyltransferase